MAPSPNFEHNNIDGSVSLDESKDDYSAAGPAAFDFRSDVVTKPTASMLKAISQASLFDDVFQEDPTTNELEEFIANMTGKESALLVTSGTMGNQLSVRTHLSQPPHSVVADTSSHIMGWEAGGIASFSGAFAIPIRPSNGHHLTLADIKSNAIISDDVHACPTRLIGLENTLAGTIIPLSDCKEISDWARSQNPPIRIHLDGARLWEAVAAGAGSLKEYCALFDSVSLCFSKGLGAPIGSIIVGSQAFIKRARHIRKAMGGGMRQTGIIAAPARVAVDETYLGGKLAATHQRAREIAHLWEKKGGRLQRQCESNMVWFDLAAAGTTKERFVEIGVEHGVRFLGGRLVVHYQIGPDAVKRLVKVMDAVLGTGKHAESANGVKEEAQEVMASTME